MTAKAFAIARQLSAGCQQLQEIIDRVERIAAKPGLRNQALPAIDALISGCLNFVEPPSIRRQIGLITQLATKDCIDIRDAQNRLIAVVRIDEIKATPYQPGINTLCRTNDHLLENIMLRFIACYRSFSRP